MIDKTKILISEVIKDFTEISLSENDLINLLKEIKQLKEAPNSSYDSHSFRIETICGYNDPIISLVADRLETDEEHIQRLERIKNINWSKYDLKVFKMDLMGVNKYFTYGKINQKSGIR